MSRVSGIAAVTKSPNNAIKISAKSLSLPPAKANQSSPPRGAGLGASLGNFASLVSIPVNLDKALYPFEIFTGMASTEPVIILSSEFIPLYSDSSGKKSKQGEAISLKEASKTLTANAAIAVLFQSTGTNISPSSLIENNSQDLSAYIAAEGGFIGQLMLKTNNAIDSMSISSFFLPSNISIRSATFPFSSAPSNQSHLPKSFYDILSSCGYKDIASFSETKLWQQTLIEIKRSLLSQSQRLSVQNHVEQADADTDSFLLSGVTSSNKKRIWLNPYQITSALGAISSVLLSENLERFQSSFNAFSNFDNRKYINIISANYTVPGDEPASLSSEAVTDIGLISSILFKEATYSSFLNTPDNRQKIETKFGYDVSQSSVNFAVWDYIIGKFSISVLDSIKTPFGLGNSLISLSQDTISTADSGYYNVLTFEKSAIENYSITPGVHYYIDGAFNTSDGKTFDTSRLDYLISKTTSALETVNFIFDLLGYEIRNGRYKKKIIPLFSLDEMIKKLSIVSSMYQGCIAGDESSYQGAFDMISRIMSDVARMINGDSGLDPRKISEISSSDNTNIRLASVICKLTVSPSDSYKGIASKLKTYLFSLFMNKIVPGRESLNFPSHYVFSILSSVRASLDSSQLAVAALGLRTFPFTTDSFSGYEVVKEHHVFEDDSYDRSDLNSDTVQKYFEDNSMLLKTNLDLDKGLWKEIFELMKSLYGSNMFLDENTSYSGLSRIAYMYSYFDLLMRVIADQTPENLMGAYTNTISGETEFQAGRNRLISDASNFGQLVGLADENEYKYQYTANEHGLVLDRPNQAQIDEIYDPASASGNRSINKFNEAISSLKAEDDLITSQLSIVRNYILSLGNALSDFKTLLQNNFEAHVGKLNGLYKRDSSLTDKQRLALINMSFTEEQLRLSSYAMSEIKDRLSASGSGDVESKLKLMPAFSTLPSGFSKFLPVNETEIISYAMLSPYFKSSEFLNIKGNNMKIMSVGIPPKLNRSLRASLSTASDNASGIKKSIIRIKVYKVDRLLPAVVYLPKTYLFEMNRFPTRIISNWDLASFSGNQTNLLSIPSKLMLPDSTVLLQKNFNEAFPDSIYSNMLTMQEKQQIYKNHSMSFLSEEYLRWFTDCRFDETRYNKFNNLDSSLTNIESQFQNFVDIVKKSSTTDTGQKIHASFVDPTSGQNYQIPVAIPSTSYISSESGQNQAVAQGQFILPMSDTIKAYFNHETLMSDPDIYKRRISYFKKFDRVFSLLIDPDDFYVDTSVTDPEAFFSLAAASNKTLVYQVENGSYKHRDTTPLDTTLNEYFLTIEPYDYVQQSM